jgi:hypothetical protein
MKPADIPQLTPGERLLYRRPARRYTIPVTYIQPASADRILVATDRGDRIIHIRSCTRPVPDVQPKIGQLYDISDDEVTE